MKCAFVLAMAAPASALNLFGGAKKPGRGTLYSDITQTIGNSACQRRESLPAPSSRPVSPPAFD